MKKKWYEALHDFFNGFGIVGYPVGGVPDEVNLPYLTYERRFGKKVNIVVHLYYYTRSESIPNEKAEEICESCRHGGKQVPYENGTIWINTGDPEWFAAESENNTVKHRIINLTLDFPMLR